LIFPLFRWRGIEDKSPLSEVTQSTFPIALQMAQSLYNENSLDAAEMLRIIVKTYNAATQVNI
jgi:hypothetical protein